MNIEILVPSEDADEVTKQVAQIPDLVISSRSPAPPHQDIRSPYQRSLSSYHVELAAIVVAAISAIKYIAPAVANIVIEYIRSRKRIVIIKHEDGTGLAMSGPLSEDEVKLAAKELESFLLQKPSKR